MQVNQCKCVPLLVLGPVLAGCQTRQGPPQAEESDPYEGSPGAESAEWLAGSTPVLRKDAPARKENSQI